MLYAEALEGLHTDLLSIFHSVNLICAVAFQNNINLLEVFQKQRRFYSEKQINLNINICIQ